MTEHSSMPPPRNFSLFRWAWFGSYILAALIGVLLWSVL
jgi:hypothetical protein